MQPIDNYPDVAATHGLLQNNLLKNGYYQTGIAAIVLSLGIFCLPMVNIATNVDEGALFLINYIITVFYFFTLWFSGKLRKRNGGAYFIPLLLILFLISAYALNRNMNVFQDSAEWLSVLLIICCTNYIGFVCLDEVPLWVHRVTGFIAGISCCLFAYLAIYLLPTYVFSAAISFLFGISLHSFVPLLFFLFTIRLVKRTSIVYTHIFRPFLAGVLFSLLFTIIFCIRWNTTNNALSRSFSAAQHEAPDMPAWVYAAQKMPLNQFTNKVLKAGLVYTTPKHQNNFGWFNFRPPSMGEKSKHDPLIMTAAYFSASQRIDSEDKINMMKVLADKRHATQERLWRGDDLITKHIQTTAEIWPSLHLAYTEKTIDVANQNEHDWDRQEAIYTFSLPEGSVVTSLSLWINGKEEKSILTTKEKAADAYNTIVGKESRDPSVVHWEEGNAVSVRVFPVLGKEERRFKIGITTPLPVVNGELLYNNIVFQGPATTNTREDIDVSIIALDTAASGDTDGNKYVHSGRYDPSWKLSWKAGDVKPASFLFDGSSYTLNSYKPPLASANIKTVYLDINESWTQEEVESVLKAANGKPAFVWLNGMKAISSTTIDEVLDALQQNHFSLFPFYEVTSPATSLIVTKSNDLSPRINELKASDFQHKISAFAQANNIRVFNIGSQLSPYLRTLRELRVLQYQQGSIDTLRQLIQHQQFAANMESDKQVVLHDAQLMIVKDSAQLTSANKAPDHLMRLFAYNHIMQRGGAQYLDSLFVQNEDLVKEAETAHIVTPFTSMVVLESKKDYDRFDIHESPQGLQNASTSSSGSVPEPHEWALIILTVATVLYLAKKRQLRSLFLKH